MCQSISILNEGSLAVCRGSHRTGQEVSTFKVTKWGELQLLLCPKHSLGISDIIPIKASFPVGGLCMCTYIRGIN